MVIPRWRVGIIKMSKWRDDFEQEFDTTGTIKRLNKEIHAESIRREMDRVVTEVIQGKHKRKGCTIVGKSNGRNVVIAETRHKSLWD